MKLSVLNLLFSLFQVLSIAAGKIFCDMHRASQSANKVLPEKAGLGM